MQHGLLNFRALVALLISLSVLSGSQADVEVSSHGSIDCLHARDFSLPIGLNEGATVDNLLRRSRGGGSHGGLSSSSKKPPLSLPKDSPTSHSNPTPTEVSPIPASILAPNKNTPILPGTPTPKESAPVATGSSRSSDPKPSPTGSSSISHAMSSPGGTNSVVPAATSSASDDLKSKSQTSTRSEIATPTSGRDSGSKDVATSPSIATSTSSSDDPDTTVSERSKPTSTSASESVTSGTSSEPIPSSTHSSTQGSKAHPTQSAGTPSKGSESSSGSQDPGSTQSPSKGSESSSGQTVADNSGDSSNGQNSSPTDGTSDSTTDSSGDGSNSDDTSSTDGNSESTTGEGSEDDETCEPDQGSDDGSENGINLGIDWNINGNTDMGGSDSSSTSDGSSNSTDSGPTTDSSDKNNSTSSTNPTSSDSLSNTEPTAGSGPWSLIKSHAGSGFFNGFDFFHDADPTHGKVEYVDQDTARSEGLASTKNNSVTIATSKSDIPLGSTRQSVRLGSQDSYDEGLIVFDVAHMPVGCATWPALWLVGPGWPNAGEIDVVENVGYSDTNQYTLHTRPGCSIQDSKFTGNLVSSDCNAYANGNAGCAIKDNNDNGPSFGPGFNEAGGGVWAAMFSQSQGVKIWFWGRSKVPSDLSRGIPDKLDPSTFGQPVAVFPLSQGCAGSVSKQQIIINIAIDGDWAGAVPMDGRCGSDRTSAYAKGSNYDEAYFRLNSINVYGMK